MKELKELLRQTEFSRDDLTRLISLEAQDDREALYRAAYAVKARTVGRVAYFRGLIEFSNICTKDCLYCGIRKSHRGVRRFESTKDEILRLAKWVWENRYGSVVLQSGERTDPKFVLFVEDVLRGIKELSRGELGITLCLGEQTEETYRRWFDAGAHRYLLRIEESNPALYARYHPQDGNHVWEVRDRCISVLKSIGYQAGTGVMIGLPGQTAENLADDILYYRRKGIDMIGMGPYIVASGTPMGDAVEASGGNTAEEKRRRFVLGLNMIAATRLALPTVNIAATTALQGLDPRGRELGLRAGANVLMPIVTEPRHRPDYQLYDDKPCVEDTSEECLACVTGRVRWAGDEPGFGSWGDSRHWYERRGRSPESGREAGEGIAGTLRKPRRVIEIRCAAAPREELQTVGK